MDFFWRGHVTIYKKNIPPYDRPSRGRKSQEISALYLYHSQRNYRSKVQKGKFTHLGGSSVKQRLERLEGKSVNKIMV